MKLSSDHGGLATFWRDFVGMEEHSCFPASSGNNEEKSTANSPELSPTPSPGALDLADPLLDDPLAVTGGALHPESSGEIWEDGVLEVEEILRRDYDSEYDLAFMQEDLHAANNPSSLQLGAIVSPPATAGFKTTGLEEEQQTQLKVIVDQVRAKKPEVFGDMDDATLGRLVREGCRRYQLAPKPSFDAVTKASGAAGSTFVVPRRTGKPRGQYSTKQMVAYTQTKESSLSDSHNESSSHFYYPTKYLQEKWGNKLGDFKEREIYPRKSGEVSCTDVAVEEHEAPAEAKISLHSGTESKEATTSVFSEFVARATQTDEEGLSNEIGSGGNPKVGLNDAKRKTQDDGIRDDESTKVRIFGKVDREYHHNSSRGPDTCACCTHVFQKAIFSQDVKRPRVSDDPQFEKKG